MPACPTTDCGWRSSRSTGQLIKLENQVRLTTVQGRAAGNARLSPDGQALAFSTYAPYPELGDNDAMSDVFSLNLATGALRWVNTDGSGNRVGVSGFSGSGPAFGVQDFLANNGKVAFFIANSTNVGAAGIYVKDLATGALTRVFGTQASVAGFRAKVSFSDDLRKAAYADQTPGSSQTSVQSPAVVDLATGAILNAATLTNGTVGNGRTTVAVMLSRDGKAAVFDNNSTILLGGPPPGGRRGATRLSQVAALSRGLAPSGVRRLGAERPPHVEGAVPSRKPIMVPPRHPAQPTGEGL